jgi:hypothetical protein
MGDQEVVHTVGIEVADGNRRGWLSREGDAVAIEAAGGPVLAARGKVLLGGATRSEAMKGCGVGAARTP